MRILRSIGILSLTVLLGAGCGNSHPSSSQNSQATNPEATPAPSPSPSSSPGASSTSTSPSSLAENFHPISIPSLFNKSFRGSNFTVGRVLARTEAYTRYYITYSSENNLTISGIMNVPVGRGPFPVLILNHGHIDTSVYTNGRGLRREQDFLAKAGYVVIHPDYRNHAQSGKDTRDELAVRLGYVEDVINAIESVKKADLPYIDKNRVGMLGHSMGGGITLAVVTARPDLVQAAILYAPVSGDMRESYERWMSRRPEAAQNIRGTYGEPAKNPAFWDNISSETFYDRITAPIHIFHGTADADVPLNWSEQTRDLLKAKNKSVELTIYPNAPHEFAGDWQAFMQSVERFFDQHL